MKKMLMQHLICAAVAALGLVPTAYAAGTLAASGVDTQYDTDPKSWGRVTRLVTPTYPADALAAGVEGVVDVEVQVSQLGSVKSVRSVTSTPKNGALEAAAQQVLDYWEFATPVSRQCVPMETTAHARLHFQIENGMPKVYLTHRAANPSSVDMASSAPNATKAKLVSTNRAEVLGSVRYPMDARRDNAEADVAGMIVVNRKTGEVLDARATVIPVKGHVSAALHRQFESAALPVMKNMTFEPIPDARDDAKTNVCVPFKFRLS